MSWYVKADCNVRKELGYLPASFSVSEKAAGVAIYLATCKILWPAVLEEVLRFFIEVRPFIPLFKNTVWQVKFT